MFISVAGKKEEKIEVDIIEPVDGNPVLVTLGSAYIYMTPDELDRLNKQTSWALAELDYKGQKDIIA